MLLAHRILQLLEKVVVYSHQAGAINSCDAGGRYGCGEGWGSKGLTVG